MKMLEIKIDRASFHVKYWGKKTLEEFMAEAKKEGAGMIPDDVEPKDQNEWLKLVHAEIVKAYNGDESVLPETTSEAIKEAVAAAAAPKPEVLAEAPEKPAKKKAEAPTEKTAQ